MCPARFASAPVTLLSTPLTGTGREHIIALRRNANAASRLGMVVRRAASQNLQSIQGTAWRVQQC
jgi:hypothetical protein